MAKGENALVAWLAKRFNADPRRVPIGIGDDMAAVCLDGGLVAMTADMLLDGVHFESGRQPFELIGRKAIACSLSDCAAMACEPRTATVSIALNQAMLFEDVQRLYEGMAGIADEYGCAIVGGDTTSWSGRLAIDVAMLAEPMSLRGPIRRSTAGPGDMIYVSGLLGGSLAGKHLTFTPRLDLARRLVFSHALHAMMDISDGLAMDLDRMCAASKCGAELYSEQLEQVISSAAREMAVQDGRSPVEHALSDGEDFELLVAGGDELGRLGFGLLPVGRFVARSPETDSAMIIVGPDGSRISLEPRGYEHFR